MASTHAEHQVIIVGGGVTGLTLALMLQHLKVNYVLLEAYGTVTPNAGASIGLYANGLRVLDQLGLYEEVLFKGQTVEKRATRDGETGTRHSTRRTNPLLIERHGYATLFMGRFELLSILYSHISEKQRIIVNKKAVQIENLEHAALVHTMDGSVFKGQAVVGADGVHSTVRREMWRIAEAKEPEVIPAQDKQNISCEHACVFGTARTQSEGPLSIEPGELIASSAPGTVAACMGGPEGKIFVFWFWALPQSQRSCRIENIPRFTEVEKQRQLALAANTIMTDSGVRLSQITNDFETSGVTALPNFVLQRWHYGRIIVIGDAAHKFNPLVGQGGNSCIESCASLVNSLQKSLGNHLSENATWDGGALIQAFRAVENQRIDRVFDMVERCQVAMRAAAWESWHARLMQKFVMPLLPLSTITDFYSSFITPGLRLEGFKDPTKTHKWLYDDEKLEKPNSSFFARPSMAKAIFAVVVALTSIKAYHGYN
ncbi:hypothetical protein FSARC_7641 [Fusarium sarcochroum]|uniref:FAD-binding domain-containing protein n=1 Tax=Fusarium sarcochroum TaxID=1208366 RepID=A0A8H4TUS3_9HYPO|nr:hypothetical protein FSARC_7641 [Fusarium sarcochroum]